MIPYDAGEAIKIVNHDVPGSLPPTSPQDGCHFLFPEIKTLVLLRGLVPGSLMLGVANLLRKAGLVLWHFILLKYKNCICEWFIFCVVFHASRWSLWAHSLYTVFKKQVGSEDTLLHVCKNQYVVRVTFDTI